MHHWDKKYRANTIPWDRGETSPALHAWLDAGTLAPGAILIPGCGRGHEALILAQRGFRVTALDFAPTALAHLAEELDQAGVEAELVCQDALTWQPTTPFDAIYEQTCLCALDPAHWLQYEAQLHAWLRRGGQLCALFMQTGKEGGPPYHCGLEHMRELFPPSRWAWPDTPPSTVPHPKGWQEFAMVLVRR